MRSSGKLAELPITSNLESERTLIEQHRQARREEILRFTALFAAGTLELAEIKLANTAERDVVLAVLRGCLRNSQHRYQAPDGSTITLVNPDETGYGLLKAPDGAILMPRYRLIRQAQEEKVRNARS